MATVHLAVDTEREQQVALKLLDSSHFGDQDIVRKFLKEGEALQRIHEAQPDAPVVRAYRFGREHDSSDGRPYVALEYLQGDNLLTRLKKRGPLTSAEAVLILKQVCQGLRAAHACKIWHRDITPDNVIVLSEKPTPRVRLIDFGVAKHQYAKRGTMDGSIMGKPPYMSPEQCRNDHVDGHSDVYSAGMLFYTMVTGEPPFTDDNPLQVMQMHEQAQRPDLPSAVPAQVRRLIQQMIQTDASDRPDADRVVQVIEGLQVTI
jgi:serine/threonine-protein kinase